MANELITNDQNRRTPWSGLSAEPKLEKLVTTETGFGFVCTPDERAGLATLLPAYEAAMAPASRSGCRRAIGKVALAFPGVKLNDDEAEARLELYADALSDIPADILAEGCMRVVRECRFFPSVAEIRERCGLLGRRRWELSRIRLLIAAHDRGWRDPGEPMTDADRIEFAKLALRIAA